MALRRAAFSARCGFGMAGFTNMCADSWGAGIEMSTLARSVETRTGEKRQLLRLRENAFHDLAVNVSEAKVAALETIRELFVIDAEAVHHRRVQVVNVNGVFDDVVTVVVRLAVSDARLDAAARH